MDYGKSLLAPTVTTHLAEALALQSLSTGQIEECVRQILEAAIEIREPQTGRLVTLKDVEHDSPVLIHYKPRTAAQVLVSLIGGIAGASNPLLLYLAALSFVLALADVREQASEEEALLFRIVFDSASHKIKRSHAKENFLRALKTLCNAPTGDFEIALHRLVNRGCLKVSGDDIAISDPIVIHRKHLP